MNNLTDHAWVSLKTGNTKFTEGVYTFNGCTVTITKIEGSYPYDTPNRNRASMSARYWGKIVFPDGIEHSFSKKRGGQVARATGFAVETEKILYKQQGEDKYVLPYLRNQMPNNTES